METTVKELRNALKAVAPIFKGHRSTLPVLGCVLLDGAALTGNNLTYALTAQFAVTTPATPIKAVVDFKAFQTALKQGKPADKVKITFTGGNTPAIPASKETGPAQPEGYAGLLTIQTNGTMSQTLKCPISPDDFPQVQPAKTEFARFTVDSAEFKAALSRVTFAAARDESRPVLTGVYMLTGETVTLATADGFRLSVDSITPTAQTTTTPNGVKANIPYLALEAIAPHLAGPVEVTVSDHGAQGNSLQVSITTARAAMTVAAIEGQYPDVLALIPKPAKSVNHITVNRAELLAAVNAVKSTSKESSWITRLERHENDISQLNVIATSAELGNAEVAVPAVIGPMVPPAAAYNNLYLAEVLAALSGETVTLQILTAEKPLLLTGDGAENFKHVLMPMSLSR